MQVPSHGRYMDKKLGICLLVEKYTNTYQMYKVLLFVQSYAGTQKPEQTVVSQRIANHG